MKVTTRMLSLVLAGVSFAIQAQESPVLENRGVGVHDPSTNVQDGDEFWIFSTGTGISSTRSTDLVNWEPGPRVFDTVPAWTREAVPRNRNGHFWAPDIVHTNGEYRLYYSVSSFGDNTSAIGLATNRALDPADPEYAWQDGGLVFQSFEDRDDYNAIDPALIVDQDRRQWMSFLPTTPRSRRPSSIITKATTTYS